MQTYSLKANLRDSKGKEKCKKLRHTGVIPAVLYGDEKQPEHLVVEEHEFNTLLRAIRGRFVMIDLEVDEKPSLNSKIMVREIQRDPLKHNVLHADFLRLSDKKEIKLAVPVRIIGSAIGIKAGGILEHLSRDLEIKSIPSKVPPFIEVDVTNLDINKSIHVSDLTLPEGIEVLQDPDTPIVHISAPRAEEVVAAAPVEGAEEVKEPELIEKKKKEETEEEESKK